MRNKPTILILDDNDMMQRFLSGYFSERYIIENFNHVSKAWKWLEEGNRPDLILADIIMPDISGIVFLGQIKSSHLGKDIPVIMLSGVDKSAERIKCLELGAADYIAKPFNPKELELRINRYLNLSTI